MQQGAFTQASGYLGNSKWSNSWRSCAILLKWTGPTCEGGISGIQNNDVCCPASCGTCAGEGCSSRDGGDAFSGQEACCGGGVRSLNRVCSDTVGAPCVVSSGEPIVASVKRWTRISPRVTHACGFMEGNQLSKARLQPPCRETMPRLEAPDEFGTIPQQDPRKNRRQHVANVMKIVCRTPDINRRRLNMRRRHPRDSEERRLLPYQLWNMCWRRVLFERRRRRLLWQRSLLRRRCSIAEPRLFWHRRRSLCSLERYVNSDSYWDFVTLTQRLVLCTTKIHVTTTQYHVELQLYESNVQHCSCWRKNLPAMSRAISLGVGVQSTFVSTRLRANNRLPSPHVTATAWGHPNKRSDIVGALECLPGNVLPRTAQRKT